jgi:hypothetical protein
VCALRIAVSAAMATRRIKSELVLVTDWAVGRATSSQLVALRLNGDEPVVLRAQDARAIAAALQNEADAVAPASPLATVASKGEEA